MSSINKGRGFTLVETIIVMALSLLLLSAIIMAYTVTLHSYTGSLGKTNLLNKGSTALERLSKDIRRSRGVFTAGPNLIFLWYIDLNGNYVTEANELVSYAVQTGKLLRTSSNEVEFITDQIRTLAFSYDNPTQPGLVTVDLTLADNSQLLTMETKSRLRNPQ